MKSSTSIKKYLSIGFIFALCHVNLTYASEAPKHVSIDDIKQSPVVQQAYEAYLEKINNTYIAIVKSEKLDKVSTEIVQLGGELSFKHKDGILIFSGLDSNEIEVLKSISSNDIVDMSQDTLIERNPDNSVNLVEKIESLSPTSQADPTLASYYDYQWNMQVIQADSVWSEDILGSEDITIAVIDSGLDYSHIDLMGRVDLTRSASFDPFDDYLVNYFFPGRHLITDLDGHGSHVGSTISTNGLGIAGITSKTTLIGAKACNAYGFCPTSAILQSIYHAVDKGADVINLSLGGRYLRQDTRFFAQVFFKAYRYANQHGVIAVVSGGNDGINYDQGGYGQFFLSQSDIPNLIVVAATGPGVADHPLLGPFDNLDAHAPYSNRGHLNDISAPGGYYGYVFGVCSSTNVFVTTCQNSPNYYYGLRGTSMAAPHVSGVASLLIQRIKQNNNGSDRAKVTNILIQSSDDLGAPGKDEYFGHGRLNMKRAILGD